MIKNVQPQGKWRVLVIDSASLKTLNAVCKMFDILEQNIALVENIEKKRNPNPEYEAIYYISPTVESVNALIADFTSGRPMYQAAHVFLTGTISERLFEKIKRSGVTAYLRKFTELHVDFLATQSCVFSLDLPQSTRVLYSNTDPGLVSQLLKDMAQKIVCVCATLGEYPLIRYYDPMGDRRTLAARLAFLLQEELDNLCRIDNEFPPKSSYPRAIMLLVDRTFDMLSPFLHDFMYQAMAEDLVPTDPSGTKFYLQSIKGDAGAAATAQVDENDALWVKYRHTHIAEVSQAITNEFKEFMERNPAAKSAAGQLAGTASGIEGIAQLKKLVFALPQFQEAKAKYSDHINLCQECMQQYTALKLERISAVEQDMVTGKTAEGKVAKDIEVDLVPILSDPSVSRLEKLRLLILYIVSHNGISDTERQKLLSCAHLSVEDSQTITNLAQFNVRLTQSDAKPSKDGKLRYNYEGYMAHEKSKSKANTASEHYVTSRWTPLLKYVIEDAACNQLNAHIFPFVKEPAAGEISGSPSAASKKMAASASAPSSAPIGGFGQVSSLRSTKPSWAKKAPGTPSSAGGSGHSSGGSMSAGQMGALGSEVEYVDYRKNGPRLLVFVAGGASYCELKAAYDCSKEYSRDVVIGTSHMLAPAEFVEELKDVHRNVNEGRGGLKDPRFGANPGGFGPRGESLSLSKKPSNSNLSGRLGDLSLDGASSDGSSNRKKGGLFGKLKF